MRRRQSGQVLVLALLALMVAVGGTVAGIRWGRSALAQHHAERAADQAGALMNNAVALYLNVPTGWSGVTAAVLIADGAAPATMVKGTGLVSPWGTPVLAHAGYDASPNDSLVLDYQVPHAACAAFASQAAGFAAAVVVGTTDVENQAAYGTPSHGAFRPAALATACQSAGNPVRIQLFSGPMPSVWSNS